LGKGLADLTMYLPKALTLRGATISEWATGTDPKERAHDMDVAIEVARSAPQVFEAVPFSTCLTSALR
jgi:hypothetical protein